MLSKIIDSPAAADILNRHPDIMDGSPQPEVFISYSTKDELIAGALVERLREEGIAYWKAPDSIPPGISYSEAIVTDIPRCRVMLVLLSDKANYSHHVERELLCALEEGKPILPVRIEKVEPSRKLRYALAGTQRVDAFPPFRQHLDKIATGLRARLETLRREAPVVRVIEPADRFTAVAGSPLQIAFEILLGSERRLRRARLEVRRDGALMLHRPLVESELNDRGGMHRVAWELPASLAAGGDFQLAVLASDNEGQEGSAQMEGSFAVASPVAPATPGTTGSIVVPATPPPAEPADAVSAPLAAVAKSQNAMAGKLAKQASAALFSLVMWSFRLVWMLAITGGLAGLVHHFAEPYTATVPLSAVYTPPAVEMPDTLLPGGLIGQPKAGSAADRLVHPEKYPDQPAKDFFDIDPAPRGLQKPGDPGLGELERQLRESAILSGQLSRLNPNPLEHMRVVKGSREPGRPLEALWNTLQKPAKWNDYFHKAIPVPADQKISPGTAFWQGAGLGAMLGLVAGVVAGMLAVIAAAWHKLPLDMLPLGEEETLWAEFSLVLIPVALTIFNTGARQPDSGRWTTPLFWWVAGLTALAFLGGNSLNEARNRRRQAAILG